MPSTPTHTFAMIKPHAWAQGHAPAIIQAINDYHLTVIGAYLLHSTPEQVKALYAVHQGEDFFESLVKILSGGLCLMMALSGLDAVKRYRTLVGATDPTQAEPQTLRARFGETTSLNAVHGSASEEDASRELTLFFSKNTHPNLGDYYHPRFS